MFEKEAEEYLKVQCQKRKEEYVIKMPEVYIADIPQAFQDGAEFGYNKSKAETALLSQHILDLQKDKGNLTDRVRELEQQIEKMKRYAKLLQDICTVMGNDVYMVSVGLENRVKVLWDSSEEKEGLKMVEDIENRLLKIRPQDWAEIDKWEIKEND